MYINQIYFPLYKLRINFFEEGDLDGALESYEQIESCSTHFSDIPMAHIYYRIGVLYSVGRFCAQPDSDKAAHYLQLAHQLLPLEGSAEALCDLGFLYNNSLGVTGDNALAFSYYQQSAKMGYRRAQFNLACMYYTGLGTPKEVTKALHYFRLAGDAGEKDAMFQVGVLLYELFKDYQNSISYLLKAVMHKNKYAPKYVKRIFKGKMGPLFQFEAKKYLSENWPHTENWLINPCAITLRDLYLCLNGLPKDLKVLIVKYSLLCWPGTIFVLTEKSD